MAPKPKQKGKTGGTSSTSTSSNKEGLVKKRALKRAERVEARRVEAEKRKEAGNAHFRAGDYIKAVREYNAAIDINGPNAPYLSNLAAAWLKLELYDEAELCAQRALVLDPQFTRARYRRGLARKGNLELTKAVLDFQNVLKQDPTSTEAKNALHETLALLTERDDDTDVAVSDDESPLLSDNKVELESVSDSSDWNHEGNGIPCRLYNHDGCTRRNDCRFSHAPDLKSVRDQLGRNVCMYFLFGNCKFGSSACAYSHDKTYLPAGRWYEDEGKRLMLRHTSKSLHAEEHPAFMPFVFGLIDDRLAWAPAHGVEMEEVFGHWRMPAMDLFREAVDIGLASSTLKKSGTSGGSSQVVVAASANVEVNVVELNIPGTRPSQVIQLDDEYAWDMFIQERLRDCGHTQDQAKELVCQDVEPRDDDAEDVLDAPHSP